MQNGRLEMRDAGKPAEYFFSTKFTKEHENNEHEKNEHAKSEQQKTVLCCGWSPAGGDVCRLFGTISFSQK
jgi:hypothetical protein